jgi:hypothetical protein
MKPVCIMILSAVLTLVSPAVGFADTDPVGIIKAVNKDAFIVRSGKTHTATPGMKVMKGDLIKTGPGSSVGVIFEDDTVLSMGPKSEFVIEEFIFRPVENKLSFVARIIRGTLSFLSGQIAKLSPGSVRLETPSATIGMRGTHVLVKVQGN